MVRHASFVRPPAHVPQAAAVIEFDSAEKFWLHPIWGLEAMAITVPEELLTVLVGFAIVAGIALVVVLLIR